MKAQWPKHTSSIQAHAQTEPGWLMRSVLDARSAGVIPPSGSESRELIVPSKLCLRSPPPELVLIRQLRREARNPFWQGTTSRSARQEVILYLWCLLRVPAAVSAEIWAGGQAGVRDLPQLRARLHRSATARSATLEPRAAARGALPGSLKSLLWAATQASPGPPAGDLAPCCKTSTSLSASALPALDHRDPGSERLSWTWN